MATKLCPLTPAMKDLFRRIARREPTTQRDHAGIGALVRRELIAWDGERYVLTIAGRAKFLFMFPKLDEVRA